MKNPSIALEALLQVAFRRQLITRDRMGPLRDLLLDADNPSELREDLDCIQLPEAAMLKELLPDDDLTLITPYVRHACLGQGRLGQTWLGVSPDGQRVAIKIIHARRLAPGPAVELLLRDVTKLIDADLHYAVPYRAAFTASDGRAVLVQDYIAGRDLNQRAQVKGAMNEPRALITIRQLAKGIHELEHLGTLHGLLHPGNIILDDNHRARITDYGLVFGSTLQSIRREFTPEALLLQTWAAPELLQSPPKLLPASDIYSLGCISYWILSDQPPFTGSVEQQRLQQRNAARPDVRRLARDTSEITAKTILKCMQIDCNRRYPNAAALGRSVQRNLVQILPEDVETGHHTQDSMGDSADLHMRLDEPAPTSEVAPDTSALAPVLSSQSSGRLMPVAKPASFSLPTNSFLDALALEDTTPSAPAPIAPTLARPISRHIETFLDDLAIEDLFEPQPPAAPTVPPLAKPLTKSKPPKKH